MWVLHFLFYVYETMHWSVYVSRCTKYGISLHISGRFCLTFLILKTWTGILGIWSTKKWPEALFFDAKGLISDTDALLPILWFVCDWPLLENILLHSQDFTIKIFTALECNYQGPDILLSLLKQLIASALTRHICMLSLIKRFYNSENDCIVLDGYFQIYWQSQWEKKICDHFY